MSHNDWFPTLCSIAGAPGIVETLKKGYEANGKTYKVHLDGYDQSGFLRSVSVYADDGSLVAMRHGDYKYVYAEQRMPGTLGLWAEPVTKLRLQKIFNLFQDPFERADITSNTYWDWNLNQIGAVYGAMDEVVQFSETFKEFPPRAFPPSFVPTTILDQAFSQIKEQRLKQ